MKKDILLAICLSAVAASCNRIEIDESNQQSSRLEINVATVTETKAFIEGSSLPDDSEIGLYFLNSKGDLSHDNKKYTANGEGASQSWSTDIDIILTGEQAAIYAYYPYDKRFDLINFFIPIPDLEQDIRIEASSEVQVDWMYATPVENVNSKNNNVTLEMHHALTAVRINIASATSSTSTKITSVGFKSLGAATKAYFIPMGISTLGIQDLFDSYNNYLFGMQGAGEIYIREESFILSDEAKTIDFITIPTGETAEIIFRIEMDGEGYVTASSPVLLESGKLYECNLFIDSNKDIRLSSINIKNWEIEKNEEIVKFEGLDSPWARIQHVDGTLYTAEEWIAAEAAGIVTDADANGVAVRNSKYAPCPHVIYPEDSDTYLKWSSSEIEIPDMLTDPVGMFDTNGKANTEAILAAVTNGVIPDAPAAQYCSDVIFANGQKGYLPAAGEASAWEYNLDLINACMNAIGGDEIPIGSDGIPIGKLFWTSTQIGSGASYVPNFNASNKNGAYSVRPVTTFTYNP